MTLGDKLKKARKDAGFTKVDLAFRSGVSASTISNYENEEVEPSFFNICCIAQVLHLSLDYLASRERKKNNDE